MSSAAAKLKRKLVVCKNEAPIVRCASINTKALKSKIMIRKIMPSNVEMSFSASDFQIN